MARAAHQGLSGGPAGDILPARAGAVESERNGPASKGGVCPASACRLLRIALTLQLDTDQGVLGFVEQKEQ
jgi:hypothetical protein